MSGGLYYFDTLSIHPQPQPLESLTSYLTRLGQHNGIKSYAGLSALFFPNDNPALIRNMADYPNIRLDHLSLISACSEKRLHSATFYNLSQKFGQSIYSRSVKQFLSRAIVSHFRYCPRCIDEKGYYSLLWRFHMIKNCSEHNCMLLDSCGNCKSRIPFLNRPFRIGVCNMCDFEFRKSTTQKVESYQQSVNERYSGQLQFLLSPHSNNINERELVEKIGIRLSELRSKRGLEGAEIARNIGIEYRDIQGIETGRKTRGADFTAYIKYIDYFSLTFTQLFENILNITESE